MILDGVLELPKSGVVILRKGSSVLVSYTTSMGANLEALYNEFSGQAGIHLEVVSAGTDLETLKLHTEYYRDYYSKRGMSLLQAPLRRAVTYKVRLVPSFDIKKVDVEITNARGESRVVGRFGNVREARDFIETYYGTDNTFCFPVYSLNSATKELVLDTQKKILDIK